MGARPSLFCCFNPNDSDVNYCQACGTLTRPRRSAAPIPSLDKTAIQERFDEFQSVFRFKPYEGPHNISVGAARTLLYLLRF